ncbi:MAG: glycine--tRNA ligase subunit beta [Pseudomonadota bacterium]
MQETLLIELLTEELPPKSLARLSEAFSEGIYAGLGELGFLAAGSRYRPFATPRRLAVMVSNVLDRQPDRPVERKGPAVAAGLDADGKPTPALQGFARSCGVAVEQLEKMHDGKNECFAFRTVKPGEALEAHLAAVVGAALKKLPAPKLMRWGSNDAEFVRPVHRLIMLHGDRIVPGEVLGLASGRITGGHRFMGDAEISVAAAQDYETTLMARGKLIADYTRRMEMIQDFLTEQARGSTILGDNALLNEVTSLVEYPQVYAGTFSEDFLSVPQECLALSMKQHQKYFPLADANGKLLPRFLVVSNLKADDPSHIVRGNERVLRARLSDAKFFYDQDRKTRLEDRVAKLGNVVYHNKLGTQLERVQRLRKLAGAIAAKLGANVELAERAAYLCKADLLTDMVGEFPELQGVMGKYYARHDNEPAEVAQAIEEHYYPRFAGDGLPADNIGAAAALADKLDALVGIYGIGLVPTGDKDPFGLRRHALGVLRILAEKELPLDLVQLLQLARSQFPDEMVADSVAVDLHGFMLERLRNYLRDRGYEPNEIEAVVSQSPTRIDLVTPRLAAVQAFRKLPEAEALATANKRIQNILKKTAAPEGEPDPALMSETAEKTLFEAMNGLAPTVSSFVQNREYTDALCRLAGVRREVDTFFDEVMVMTDEPLTRNNRLALLKALGGVMNQVADISKLAG